MQIVSISVVIPVLNEERQLPVLLAYLQTLPYQHLLKEILVVDGGSTDQSVAIAKQFNVTVVSSSKGRAVQLNRAAKAATGNILYFLHADTYPPAEVYKLICEAISKVDSGCFRLKFDTKSFFLKANAWFTRFDINAIRFGDQSLFVEKTVFEAVGGFDEKYIVLEDQDIVKRIKKSYTFKVLAASVSTSDRKYQVNGAVRLQLIFFLICMQYHLGFSQAQLVRFYKKHVAAANI
jgi:rSAM/selenodomain-associated transferase 2